MKTIPITTVTRRRKFAKNVFIVLSRGVLSLCIVIYVICAFQVNAIGSETKKLENSITQMAHDTTDLQTRIYSATKDTDFLAQASAVGHKNFSEPKDVSILYMRLPDTTLVMKY